MDKYLSFEDLASHETEGVDYQIRSLDRGARWAVMAPHGGGIEPGTSEIATATAGRSHTFYLFEGLKSRGNQDLHLTSTRFDEPIALDIASRAERILTIHGEDSGGAVVYVGGRAKRLRNRLGDSLTAEGFVVKFHPNPDLSGEELANLCNRGLRHAGVQLELSNGLRRLCFESLSRTGRRTRTPLFHRLAMAIRRTLIDEPI